MAAGACASAHVALADLAPQMLLDYPGYQKPELAIWCAADDTLTPDNAILEAFGPGALMSTGKLAELNAGRAPDAMRPVSEALAPFDIDARGTVVGSAGSGVIVTTLDFAVRHNLDITAIVAGWGQSGESGGKGHFAGVGFGGENALIGALHMAHEAHGLGLENFRHLIAHATGTRTNAKTELGTVHNARKTLAAHWGHTGPLPTLTVGAPKALGDGHSMGETGLKATSEGIAHVLGDLSVGVPGLRHPDPDLGEAAEYVKLSADPVPGNAEGGFFCETQGFGGYDAAFAGFSANADVLRWYQFDDTKALDAYLERWPQTRKEREARERRWSRTRGATLTLAEAHRWPMARG